jgi:hypothetical protein
MIGAMIRRRAAPSIQALQGLFDEVLALGVEGARGLVEGRGSADRPGTAGDGHARCFWPPDWTPRSRQRDRA